MDFKILMRILYKKKLINLVRPNYAIKGLYDIYVYEPV